MGPGRWSRGRWSPGSDPTSVLRGQSWLWAFGNSRDWAEAAAADDPRGHDADPRRAGGRWTVHGTSAPRCWRAGTRPHGARRRRRPRAGPQRFRARRERSQGSLAGFHGSGSYHENDGMETFSRAAGGAAGGTAGGTDTGRGTLGHAAARPRPPSPAALRNPPRAPGRLRAPAGGSDALREIFRRPWALCSASHASVSPRTPSRLTE